MDIEYSIWSGASILATAIGIIAAVTDRFQNTIASVIALGAGLSPWILYLDLNGLHWYSVTLGFIGLLGMSPLFFIALILYGMKREAGYRSKPAIAALLGTLIGGIYTISIFAGLSRFKDFLD